MSDHSETIAYCHSCGAAMDVTDVAPFTNVECPKCGKHTRVKREFGPYTLVRRHAVGGMSMVFAAHDNTLDREVALKILSEEFSADERRITAFEEEARITASFSHPNVVRVLTTGRAFGRFYIAMEFVPGGHFEHQIRERGVVPEVEMLPIAIEVAQGLKAAHAAGLIHRDVKPGNILLDAEGHAKLVDFGLALVTQGGKAQATELWATPYYVPPETVEGCSEDFRSDIYAFGATVYHALAGKPPCGEETMATELLREAKKKVLPLSVVAPMISLETCRIVERAMAYEPSARFASYDEMIGALAVALSHVKSGRSELPGTSAKRRAQKKRKERLVLTGGVVAALVVVTLLLIVANRGKPAQPVVKKPATGGTVPSPTAGVDPSSTIARNYREARAAVEARDFAKAGAQFTTLQRNPAVQEPTRSWAGVEAVLVAFLDGRPMDARKQARETVNHVRSLPQGSTGLGKELVEFLDKLDETQPLPVPKAGASGAGVPAVFTAMLAGLKDWEQGITDQAAACFKEALAAKLPQEDQWAAVYQALALDYLNDHRVLAASIFAKAPADKAGCLAAAHQMDGILGTLKTRGRARFNVRAWQTDLLRQAKLLEESKQVPPVQTENPIPKLPEVLARLAGFSSGCRFNDAVGYLKSLPEKLDGGSRSSLLTLAESSAVFLADLEDDLAKEAVTVDLPLKSGEIMSRIAIDAHGALCATAADGLARPCKWSDFSADALIVLHRELVKNPKSELERLRRHECAIAYGWLTGNRERAIEAAAKLSQQSPSFKQRWDQIAGGLPK